MKANSSVRHGVAIATVHLTAFAIAAKLLSVAQQLLLARVVGATADADAYFIAQIVPLLLGTLGAVALTTSIVPLLRAGEMRLPELNGIVMVVLGMLAAGSLAVAVFNREVIAIIGHGLAPGTAALARGMLRQMAVLVFFVGAGGVLNAFYYADSRFLAPAISSTLLYVGGILGVVLKPWVGVYSLAWGLVAGGAAQFLLLVMYSDPRWRARPVISSGIFLEFGRLFLPIFLTTATSVFYLIIDRSYATAWPAGYVAAFALAGNLMTIPTQLVIYNMNTALLPTLVGLRGNASGFAALLRKALAWATFLLAPVIILMLVSGKTLAGILFRGGSFGPDATLLTGSALAAYSLSVLGISLKDLTTIALIALGRRWTAVMAGIGSLAASVLFKHLLVPLVGPLGIAWATSAATLLAGIILLAALSKALGCRLLQLTPLSGWKIVAAGMLTALAAMSLPAHVRDAGGPVSGSLFVMAAFVLYLACCGLLRVEQMSEFARQIKPWMLSFLPARAD